MLKFDKIKIVSSIKNISIINENSFTKIIKEDYISSLKYNQLNPLIYIEVAYDRCELIIEFTGKILGKDYPKLICDDTIEKCFEAINALGICRVNPSAMMFAEVVKCDVTKDIDCDDIAKLTNTIYGNIYNCKKYVCHKLPNGNITIEKNVTTKRYKKRLTIYDKYKEMQRQENSEFRSFFPSVSFEGKCRFELNLNCKEQIRNSLKPHSTRLCDVLMADTNPIGDFLNEILQDDVIDGDIACNAKNYLKTLLIKECDYDIVKVEAKLRTLYSSSGTNIRKVITPYRRLLAKLNEGSANFKQTLLSHFPEIVIFLIIVPLM